MPRTPSTASAPSTTGRGSVAASYVALARAFLPRARALAERTGAEWPEAYERATVAYFERMTGAEL